MYTRSAQEPPGTQPESCDASESQVGLQNMPEHALGDDVAKQSSDSKVGREVSKKNTSANDGQG